MKDMLFREADALLQPHDGEILRFEPETLLRDACKQAVLYRARRTLDDLPCPGWDFIIYFFKCECCDNLTSVVVTSCNHEDLREDGLSRLEIRKYLKHLCLLLESKAVDAAPEDGA